MSLAERPLIVDVGWLYAGAVACVAGDDASADAAGAHAFTAIAGFFEVPGDRWRKRFGDDHARLARHHIDDRPAQGKDDRQSDDVQDDGHTEKVPLVSRAIPKPR